MAMLMATSTLQAQPEGFYNTIPTNKNIDITLTYCDSTLLPYYYMYSFEYFNGMDIVAAEMLVPKKEDSFHKKLMLVNTKLCRIKKFVNTIGKDKYMPIKVNDFLQVIQHGGKDTVFLNFDPMLPNPVLTPCNSKQ